MSVKLKIELKHEYTQIGEYYKLGIIVKKSRFQCFFLLRNIHIQRKFYFLLTTCANIKLSSSALSQVIDSIFKSIIKNKNVKVELNAIFLLKIK